MYRFCGMCGATLQNEPTAGAPPAEKPAEPMPELTAPPSPSEPSSRDLSYLLEDEPPKSRGKLYLTLLLLIIAAGVIAWHWEADRSSSNTSRTATNSPPAEAPAVPPAAAPAKPAHVEESKPASPPTAEATSPPATVSAPQKAPEDKTMKAASAALESSPKPGDTPSSHDTSASADSVPPATAPVTPPVRAPKPKPEVKAATPPAPVLHGDDKLVADGEKYLYGNGVPENCDLAQKNLKAAAAHSNARALTLMGAMYATGHCVARDLPTAYRWFAKALHQDPSNARVQQDLEILWRQMTPGEKQLATRND